MLQVLYVVRNGQGGLGYVGVHTCFVSGMAGMFVYRICSNKGFSEYKAPDACIQDKIIL
jgi:hypothetical protein